MLVVVTILATVCGRAKDEVCRVQSAWIECMLRSAIFDKSLRLSPASRLVHPPAKIINITAVDVGFLTNYVLKIHDVWSSPIQIVGIAILTASVMGWTGLIGKSITKLSSRLAEMLSLTRLFIFRIWTCYCYFHEPNKIGQTHWQICGRLYSK